MKNTLLLGLFLALIARLAAAGDPAPTEVLYFDHAKVEASFGKGLPLLVNGSYKVHTSRRVTPGTVEVHEHDTDIFCVIEGSAVVVTGGTLVNPKTTEAGEIRAPSSTGGVEHRLGKGDVMVIPKGTPHWFKEVSGPMLYYTVKVTN